MAVTKEDKASLVVQFGASEKDTGKPEVQVAILSKRITELTEHFKAHKHDTNSRRGLLKIVGQRRKMLKYLKRTDLEKYRTLIEQLGIRK